jgi:hypothetical protein
MDLANVSVSPRDLLRGVGVFEATAGKRVKIETSPRGLDVLNVQVPEGERWEFQVNIQIEKFTI